MHEAERQSERTGMAEALRGSGITDERVLAAFERVPRHLFVPPGLQYRAYENTALPIDLEQTISQPFMVALMLEAAQLTGEQHVLEIGSGSGYQTALLAALCRSVVSVERLAFLAEGAGEKLRALGCANVTLVVGDGTEGYAAQAPYDRIIVSAGSPHVPEPLQQQMASNALLVIPVGDYAEQSLCILRNDPAKGIVRRTHGRCAFVPLIGRHGWNPAAAAEETA